MPSGPVARGPVSGQLPPGHPPIGGAGMPATGAPTGQPDGAAGDVVSGKVQEIIPADRYQYLRLQTGDGEVWAAVLRSEVTVGQTVTVEGTSRHENFESASLKRTFPVLLMGMLRTGGAASAPTAPPAKAPGTPAAAPTVGAAAVPRATGEEARTVAEIHAQKTALSGKRVRVRGRVVKYNEDILGKNWVHLQDGSGDPKTGNNDILVTTSGKTAVGADITVSGTVALDKDFGAGYRYAVLVDEGTLEPAPAK